MFSQAAAALAAALGHSPKKAEPSLRGRSISSEAFTYDLDSLQPNEAPQELVVSDEIALPLFPAPATLPQPRDTRPGGWPNAFRCFHVKQLSTEICLSQSRHVGFHRLVASNFCAYLMTLPGCVPCSGPAHHATEEHLP
jgi:hypothetical protein